MVGCPDVLVVVVTAVVAVQWQVITGAGLPYERASGWLASGQDLHLTEWGASQLRHAALLSITF